MNNITSKLGLGTVQFGLEYGIGNKKGMTSIPQVDEILKICKEYKINTIDTAQDYGKSEEVLGKFDLNNFNLVSKFKIANNSTIDIHKTLHRLRVNSLYGFLSHSPLEILNSEVHWNHLKELKSKKIVKKIGFSFNTLEEFYKMLEVGFIPDIIQIPFNYLDNRFKNLCIELKNNYGTEVHSRSTFLQGLFFQDIETLSVFFESIKPILSNLQKIKNLASELLSYSISQTWIDRVIIGVNNSNQLYKNINNLHLPYNLPKLEYSINKNVIIPSNWQ